MNTAPRVGGFFDCDVDRKKVFGDLQVHMYPDKINTWLIAYPAQETTTTATFNLFSSGMGLRVVFPADVESVQILETYDSPPPLEEALQVSPYNPEKYEKTPFSSSSEGAITYARVQFVFNTDREFYPWPWFGKGFLIKCPENLTVGLVATFPPEDLPEDPTDRNPGIFAGLAEIPKAIGKATNFVIWAGAIIVLFQIVKTTQAVRKTVT